MLWLLALVLAVTPPAPAGLHLACGSGFVADLNDPDGYITSVALAPDQHFSWLSSGAVHIEAQDAQGHVVAQVDEPGNVLWPAPAGVSLLIFTGPNPFTVYPCDPLHFVFLPLSRSS